MSQSPTCRAETFNQQRRSEPRRPRRHRSDQSKHRAFCLGDVLAQLIGQCAWSACQRGGLAAMAMSALYYPALAQTRIVKSINATQISDFSVIDQRQIYTLGDPYQINCHGTLCMGHFDLKLSNVVYEYDLLITLITDETKRLRMNLSLRPTQTDCDPRCTEPSLHSETVFLPWKKNVHAIVPLKQFGVLSQPRSPGNTDEPVYREMKEPVAYIDLSIDLK
jgi:hypothetical protein